MTPRVWRVVFTARAARQVEAIETWWRAERLAAPDLFREELICAVERLAQLPGTGTPRASSVRGVRRILLPRSRFHAYYTMDAEARTVIVRAIWHAARGRGPALE